MNHQKNEVGFASLFAYGLPALGLQATTLVASLYLLKFATEELLIAPAVVGTILAVSRIWDAISDPLVGHASDRTRTRLGRRRPWILLGAPLLAVSFTALWIDPGDMSSALRITWLTFAIVVFYTAYTFVSVPHYSLGATLSGNGHQRNRIYAARGVLQNAGLFIALVGVYFIENADPSTISTAGVGAIIGCVSGIIISIGGLTIREPAADAATLDEPAQSSAHNIRAFRDVASDRSARLVFGVIGLQELATGSLLVVLPFASEYIVEAPGQTAFYLMCFVVPMTASLPIWVRVGRTINPLHAWRIGNIIAAFGFLAIVVAGPGWQMWLGVCAGVIGAGYGATRVFTMSAVARIADEDTERAGRSKTGLFFAAATFTEKCAVALAAFGVGVALQASGFDANVTPGTTTLHVLRVLTSVLPASFMAISCLLLSREQGNEQRPSISLHALQAP